MTTLSPTSLSTLLTCETKYYWRYVRNLRLRNAPLATIRGEAAHAVIHAALQKYAEYGAKVTARDAVNGAERDIEAIFQRERSVALFGDLQEGFSEAIDEGVGSAMYFVDNILPNKNWGVKELELGFERQIPYASGKLRGRVDAVVEAAGMLFIVDHKTYARPVEEDHLILNLQLLAYLWALQGEDCHPSHPLDKEVTDGLSSAGVMLNVLPSSPPVAPRLLKNGSLSKDKSQRTTRALYLQAIEDARLRREDYEDFLALLDDSKYTQTLMHFPNPGQMRWIESVLQSCAVRATNVEHTGPLPSGTYACSMCDYRPLCVRHRIGGVDLHNLEADALVYCTTEEEEE